MNWKKIIKTANSLDQKGFYKEADELDCLLKSAVALSPEEYERYYGKPKYNKPTSEIDVSKPEYYKKYYGRELKEEPVVEKEKPIEKTETIVGGNTLGGVLKDIKQVISENFSSSFLGTKFNIPSTSAVITALQFDSSYTAEAFIKNLSSAGFKLTFPNEAVKSYEKDNSLQYGGRVLITQSEQVPRIVKVLILSHAPENQTKKELTEAFTLAKYYF